MIPSLWLIQPGEDMFPEEGAGLLGAEGVGHAIHHDAYAGVLALLHAEGPLEGKGIVGKTVLLHHLLKGLDDIVRTLEMAGAADADAQHRHINAPPSRGVRAEAHGPGP